MPETDQKPRSPYVALPREIMQTLRQALSAMDDAELRRELIFNLGMPAWTINDLAAILESDWHHFHGRTDDSPIVARLYKLASTEARGKP